MSIRDLRGWLLLAAAVLVAVLAFFLMRNYLSSREHQMRLSMMQGRGDTTRVIVAKHELHPGDVISAATVAIGKMPSAHVPGRAVFPRDFDQVEEKVLDRPLAAGETVQADFVAGLVVDRFSDLLEKGQRAVSLQVASMQNVSGMLLPGDYVDLFVWLKAAKTGEQKRLEPVLGRVKVLAAGAQPLRAHDQSFQRLPKADDKYHLITVGVSLADAKRLVEARQKGQIVYFLRNSKDTKRLALSLSSMGDAQSPRYWYNSGSIPDGERRRLPHPESATGPALAAESMTREPASAMTTSRGSHDKP